MRIKAIETGELVPDHYEAKIVEEEDRFNFNAIFESGEQFVNKNVVNPFPLQICLKKARQVLEVQ